MMNKFEDMFIRFNRIHERDRETDGQTPHDGMGRACIERQTQLGDRQHDMCKI